MKRILTILFLCLICRTTYASQNLVNVTVTGEGPTKQVAIDDALRSAIEQTYGVFVSANTFILNDNLVKDEIATISSGNIVSYEEISSLSLDGLYYVTIQAEISLTKLVSYAKNHGSKCELDGSAFAANKRLFDFNTKNAERVYANLKKIIKEAAKGAFDFEIEVSEPRIEQGYDVVDITTKLLANTRTKAIGQYIVETLYGITLSRAESKEFRKSGFEMNRYFICLSKKGNAQWATGAEEINDRWSYIILDTEPLNSALFDAANSFNVSDNNGRYYPSGISVETVYQYKEDALIMGVGRGIAISLDYKSGEVIQTSKQSHVINNIDSITSFSVNPYGNNEVTLPQVGNIKRLETKTTYFVHYNWECSLKQSYEDGKIRAPGINQGLFLGFCKLVGPYVRFNIGKNRMPDTKGFASEGKTVKTDNEGFYFAGGLMFRPVWCLYPYVGVGYSTIQPKRYDIVSWGQHGSDDQYELRTDFGKPIGITGEVGLAVRFSYMSLSVGASLNAAGTYIDIGVGVAL